MQLDKLGICIHILINKLIVNKDINWSFLYSENEGFQVILVLNVKPWTLIQDKNYILYFS